MLTPALFLATLSGGPVLDYSVLKPPVGTFRVGFRTEYKGDSLNGVRLPVGVAEGSATRVIQKLGNGNYRSTQTVNSIHVLTGDQTMQELGKKLNPKTVPTEEIVFRPDGTIVSTSFKTALPYFKHPKGKITEGMTWSGFVRLGSANIPAEYKLIKFETVDGEMCARIEGFCRSRVKGPKGDLNRQINILSWLGLKTGQSAQNETQIRDEYNGQVRITDSRGWRLKPKSKMKIPK